MQKATIVILIAVVTALGACGGGRDSVIEVTRDLTTRDPAAFHDFNVQLLTHLGKPITLDVKVAAKDVDRKDGWLFSSYFITPNELRGIELRVPSSAISGDGEDHLRVRGEFTLSEVMGHRQGQISLHLLPVE